MSNWNNNDHNNNGDSVDFEASYDFTSDITLDFSAEFEVESEFEVDHQIDVCVDINGNLATFEIDVQAYGDDSATELNLVVFVNDEYSTISATGFAAVA
jgi:hypothetical protein